jgi:hypothetical protein
MQVSSTLPTVSVFQTEQTMNVYSYSMAVSELLFGPIGHMNPSSMFIQNRKPFKQLKCSGSLFFMQHLKWTTDILTFNKRKAIVHPALKLYKLFCVSSTEIVQVVLCIQHWNCTSCFVHPALKLYKLFSGYLLSTLPPSETQFPFPVLSHWDVM